MSAVFRIAFQGNSWHHVASHEELCSDAALGCLKFGVSGHTLFTRNSILFVFYLSSGCRSVHQVIFDASCTVHASAGTQVSPTDLQVNSSFELLLPARRRGLRPNLKYLLKIPVENTFEFSFL